MIEDQGATAVLTKQKERKDNGSGQAAASKSAAARGTYRVTAGSPHPFGATPDANGVNFALFSQNSTGVELLLFDEHDDLHPMQIITLDPKDNRTFYTWHCYVEGLRPGAHYAYRVDGPTDVHQGHRFNKNKVLIDPYARGNTDTLWERVDACSPDDNLDTSMRSVVIDMDDYDWEGDRPLNRPMHKSVIYEVNVGGFTRSSTSGVDHPGTFQGIIDKIPYLQELGVTAVELLPVFEFDNKETLRTTQDGRKLTNYWGYSTLGFFAPEASYCKTPAAGSHVREFRDMVKALHKAGIEVILDVVFNHTNEGNHQGPAISFKGVDNSVYYYLVPWDKQYYMDYSGCGNTLNCNHPVVEKFIIDCLEFWVREMHVDGFRFDEASILSRGEDGAPLEHPPVLWSIELSETLADTKIIAEAWDAAGLYQIGNFPGCRWSEWNGRFRDDVRAFVAGRPGMVGAVASRIAGSADLYQGFNRRPTNSINFVTCHDGFTLNDLVSYNGKHNDANGEDNRDGINDNISWNCGWEGDTDNAEVQALREKQVKNFCAILMLSQGVPMVLGGDEMRRTQQGNNNAYCQDSEISWHDWSQLDNNRDVFNFFKGMIDFRKRHACLQRCDWFDGGVNQRGVPEVSWHGCKLNSPGWQDPGCRVLSFTLGGVGDEADIHAIFNMDDQDLDFELPPLDGRRWYKAVDTALPGAESIAQPGREQRHDGDSIRATARSVVVLMSKK